MIDFLNINAFDNGQRDSFESLVCILAKREQIKDACEFQPNDGRGGDGGVEALWILNNGDKIGYQAKFFKNLGGPQWRQMDESVKRALKTHPKLIKYVFALPFDLTGDRGSKARGESQRKKWDDKVKAWKDIATIKAIEFELWDSTTLIDKVLRDGNEALQKYWFGGDVLNNVWFQQQVNSAVQKLNDRFNPVDHVEVSIESMFDSIVRGPSALQRLDEAFANLESNRVPTIKSITTSVLSNTDDLKATQEGWDELVAMRSSIDLDPAEDWNWPHAQEILGRLQDAIRKLRYSLEQKEPEDVEDVSRGLRDVSRELRDLSAAIDTLEDLLREQVWLAEATRCVLIYGGAGAGKSHTLGQVAAKRVGEDLPTIVVLGQDLSNMPFWPQLGELLGLEGKTSEDILGVLNAVGERKGVRTLLLFDAINEGVGAAYWMHWMPAIIAALKSYPYIAAVFSCRDEYLPYSVPKNLMETLPKFKVEGFTTPDERERAAIQYLDKKSISRPNTPWLSPEFSNPLFLKSASEALVAKGKTEFPRGFQGISKLMALYLDGLSARTSISAVNAGDLSPSLKDYVHRIANRMAGDGQDFVDISTAEQYAGECFGNRQPPEGKTWLDVFIQANVFRLDAPPYSEKNDSLKPPSELVRFSFQRFQDFLMADSLVEKVNQQITGSDKKDLCRPEFQQHGPLSFIFYDGSPDKSIQYKYAGLVGALSTIYPEKLGIEFAKSLPDWEKHWKNRDTIQHAFGESFKSRSLVSFTEDTRELLNLLDEHPVDLLLEVSMTVNHPYNAECLHEHLKNFKLAERDSDWTRWVNWPSDEEFSQVDRIVSWALSSRDRPTDLEHMQLASLVLTWFLSSSYMTLRDRATKALTVLFLKNQDIFGFVLEKMHDCDDPYIIERLYAAAFGACCICQNPDRLKSYSQSVFTKVFADQKPPVALLTRDYALGIIELAASKDALNDDIEIGDCYHPFVSDAPVFDLTKEQVEAIAGQRGGEDILMSASSEGGDYGKYSIPAGVRDFLTTPLSESAPISKSEIKQIFVKDVIKPFPDRVEALKYYEDVLGILGIRAMGGATESETVNPEQSEITKKEARSRLEKLLDAGEKQRLVSEYFREDQTRDKYEKVNIDQCRLWITKRAYELGWTVELFPEDRHFVSSSRRYNDLERIGKKYQRIALDELQARLADHFWILWRGAKRPHIYKYSHNEVRRNIEPTILPTELRYPESDEGHVDWITEPKIVLPEVPETELKHWPFLEYPTTAMYKKLVRIDENKRRWLVLYEMNVAEDNYENPNPYTHSKRFEEFRFFYCVFLKKGKTAQFTEYLKRKQDLDVGSFEPRGFIDGPYLGEAFWRDTWCDKKFTGPLWNAPTGCEFAIPSAYYRWESHLDKTLPNGFSNYMPQKWFADELGLTMSPMGPQYWNDSDKKMIIQSQQPTEHQTAMVIDEKLLFEYAEEQQIEPVWLMIAERNAWPGGDYGSLCYRRSEGAIWFEGENWQQVGWNKDLKH